MLLFAKREQAKSDAQDKVAVGVRGVLVVLMVWRRACVVMVVVILVIAVLEQLPAAPQR